MSYIFHTFFFNPLYNLLVFLFDILPLADAGVIVILLTIIVRLIIFPLSRKAIVTQVKMAEIAPEISSLKEKYKDKPEELARKTLDLYKEKKVNPFSGILVIFIQIPVLLAIYRIFLHAGFPQIDSTLLYSFIHIPERVSTTFLGFIDITQKNLPLAILAGVSAFFQLRLAAKNQSAPKGDSFSDNLARSMQLQMKYVFPIIIFFIAYQISGVIALYFLTTNIFTIGQEIFIRRKLKPISA